MNYDKLILEILSRVQNLEEKVKFLEEQLEHRSIEETIDSSDGNDKITRSVSRQYVINKLKENNNNLIIEKANRAMGSGIVVSDTDGKKVIKFKFNHSKSHSEDCPSGWHTVNNDELISNDIDGFIFNLEYKKDFHTFLFTTAELREYVKIKEKDMNGNYHFYFNINNGKIVDFRDNQMDVSRYYSRWDLISKMI